MNSPHVLLSDLRPGDRARVLPALTDHPATPKLLAMGLLPGTEICVVQIAPLGDPVEIEFRGMRLSLRRADAAGVHLEKLP
jgi:Fe2+ transport system protein FeoA